MQYPALAPLHCETLEKALSWVWGHTEPSQSPLVKCCWSFKGSEATKPSSDTACQGGCEWTPASPLSTDSSTFQIHWEFNIYTNQLDTFWEDQSTWGTWEISLAVGRVSSRFYCEWEAQNLTAPIGRALVRKDLLSSLSKIFRLICIISNCFLHGWALQVLCKGDTWRILPWFRQKSVQEGRTESALHREASKVSWISQLSNPSKMTSKKTSLKNTAFYFFLTKLFN